MSDGDNTGRKIEKALNDVIAAARVAVLGDDDESDPNLRELRKTLRKLDRVKDTQAQRARRAELSTR